jgi:hypothetical protein
METQQTRFRVEVKHPDKTKEYLLKLDSETPEGESIDYPRLRAAQAIKLNFSLMYNKRNSVKLVKPRHPK